MHFRFRIPCSAPGSTVISVVAFHIGSNRVQTKSRELCYCSAHLEVHINGQQCYFEPANATNEIAPWSFSDIECISGKTARFMQAVDQASSASVFGRPIRPPAYATAVPDE